MQLDPTETFRPFQYSLYSLQGSLEYIMQLDPTETFRRFQYSLYSLQGSLEYIMQLDPTETFRPLSIFFIFFTRIFRIHNAVGPD